MTDEKTRGRWPRFLLIWAAVLLLLGLIGCGVCGFSVGILWPGTFSKAAASLKRGGTMMFSLLALAGDVGCSCGPSLVGAVSGGTGSMKKGILAAGVFPVLMVVGVILLKKKNTEK
mgnify:CR=1 FL=1